GCWDAGSAVCHDVLFFFQAEDGIRCLIVTGVQTCALPISRDAVANARGCGNQVEPELALQSLLHDFHVQQPKEAAAEAEAERDEIGRASCRERWWEPVDAVCVQE